MVLIALATGAPPYPTARAQTPAPAGTPCAPPVYNPSLPTNASTATTGIPVASVSMPSGSGSVGSLPPPQTPPPSSGIPPASVTTPSPDPNPTLPCEQDASLEAKLFDAAAAFRGQSTSWPGTGCYGHPDGWCACAAAVRQIVFNATQTWAGNYSVDSWLSFAQTGSPYGGRAVPDALAIPGDIIIWFTDPNLTDDEHIGFCASTQCTSTWSNSSRSAVFAPADGGITNFGEYPYHLIWEPGHIP